MKISESKLRSIIKSVIKEEYDVNGLAFEYKSLIQKMESWISYLSAVPQELEKLKNTILENISKNGVNVANVSDFSFNEGFDELIFSIQVNGGEQNFVDISDALEDAVYGVASKTYFADDVYIRHDDNDDSMVSVFIELNKAFHPKAISEILPEFL